MTASSSLEVTRALAVQLAEQLHAGDLVLVRGEMGSGKTTFVRFACEALGITTPVTSPTFTIGRRYEGGRVPVSHLDLYRLGDMALEDPALLADYLTPDRVVFVEWPEVDEAELHASATWEVRLEHAGEDRREIGVVALP